jgi:hypothetical protein
VKQGSSGKPVKKPSRSQELEVEQLKRLIEIQSQVVNLARQNEIAEKKRNEMQRQLAGRRGIVRRALGALAQIWQRNRPLDSAS